MTKKTVSEQIMQELAGSEESRAGKVGHVAEIIRAARQYRWVGIYELDGDEIAAIAWTGNQTPSHPRFPITQGLCGAAARAAATVVAGDVRNDARYLTTFGSTCSEIVIPIFDGGDGPVVGLIDVESDRVNAFGDEDRSFLERCALAVGAGWRAR